MFYSNSVWKWDFFNLVCFCLITTWFYPFFKALFRDLI